MTVLMIAGSSYGQSFEGKITYQNTYKSKVPNMTDEQLKSAMGESQIYLIKGGNYRSDLDSDQFLWSIYVNKDNRLYSKMAKSDTIYWIDAGKKSGEIQSVQINRGVTDILGYKCDEVIFTLKDGIEKYYFSSKLPVVPALYSRHLYGNWYDYLKIAKALPLKSVVENSQFVITSLATEVKAMKLENKDFRIPQNAKTTKSPY